MLVVWKKDNDNYYFRFVNGMYCKYDIGYCNQYGHEVILIVDTPYTKQYNFRQKLIMNIVSFLNRRI